MRPTMPALSTSRGLYGAWVPFTVPSYLGETFFGVVARVAHSMNQKTRTMPVELDVSNPNLRVAPGMYAQTLDGLYWTLPLVGFAISC